MNKKNQDIALPSTFDIRGTRRNLVSVLVGGSAVTVAAIGMACPSHSSSPAPSLPPPSPAPPFLSFVMDHRGDICN